MSDYQGKANYGKPKTEYIEKISGMKYDQLYKETKDKIWLSAYANNNPRSDYHWQCDACYDEWATRNDNESYNKAWKEASGQ